MRRLLAAVGGVLLAGTTAGVAAQSTGLNVLLTNADGFEAHGLQVMRSALIEAGHRVTVVAPLGDRSGAGVSVTLAGTIDYYPQAEGVWAVDGTPADAVSLGLVHVMRDDPPDVVVSGADFGRSVGVDVLSSGTVGAALTAARAGVPGIAASVAIDGRQAVGAEPMERTRDAAAGAAGLVVEMLRQLAETGGAGLLPPRTVLNVNYPAVGTMAPEGVRFATVSALRGTRPVYSVAGESGPARVEQTPNDASRAEDGSDLALLAAGFATISVLDGRLDAGRASWEPLLERLVIER